MSFGGARGGLRDDADTPGPPTSASDGEVRQPTSDQIDTAEESHQQQQQQEEEEEEEEETPDERHQVSVLHNIPDESRAVSSNQRLVSQGEPSLSQVAWPLREEGIAGVRRSRYQVAPGNTTSSDSQQEYLFPSVPVPVVARPAATRLPSAPSGHSGNSSPARPPPASSHYDTITHSTDVAQVPQVTQLRFIMEQPYVSERLTLPEAALWERAIEPSPPSSGEHSERPQPNRMAERPVNWDTDSSSYPTTSGSNIATSSSSRSSRAVPSHLLTHSSSPRDITVSDFSSYPTSSSTASGSTHPSSSSLSSTASQQQHGRAVTSSSGGLGDVSEVSEPLDHSAEDGELFHPPTQTLRLPDVTQLDVRTLVPRSTQKKTSDESTTTSSSSCGPPQRVGLVAALSDPPQRGERRGRQTEGRGSEEGSSDLSGGGMEGGGQGDSPASYKLPGWIQKQAPPEVDEPSQPEVCDHHGNRKRPAPQGSLPALLPPPKLTRRSPSEVPGDHTSASESCEGGDGGGQANLPRWIAEEREMGGQPGGSSGHQPLVKCSGSGTSGSGSSSSADRPSVLSELPVPLQHSTPSRSHGDHESPEGVVLAEEGGTVWAPETVEEEGSGRGTVAPSSVCPRPSADSSVLVPDTPLGSVDRPVRLGSDNMLAVPDTQDSISSSLVQMREESKEEEELFSPEVLTVDSVPPSSFSLQLSQLSEAPVGSQEDMSASTQATGEAAVTKDSSSSTTSSGSAGTHKSRNRPSSGDSSSDGAGAGGTVGRGTAAVGGGGGGWTASVGVDSTQEQGRQSQQSSLQDSVVVLDDSSMAVLSDVKESGEVPVGASEDVIVLGDSMEVQGTAPTVQEGAPASDDYEGETLPYTATVEEEVGGEREGSPANNMEGEGSPANTIEGEGRPANNMEQEGSPANNMEGDAVQQVTVNDGSSESKSSSDNPFQFTTTRSPSKRTEHVKQSACEMSSLKRMEMEGSDHHGNPDDVAMETEHQVVASTVGGQGSFQLATANREQQQSSSDSQFVLPAVQVQNESQSQFQDAFLFKPSFKIDRPTFPTTSSASASPRTPPTFAGHLATHQDRQSCVTDPYEFTSQDGPFPEGTSPHLPGLPSASLRTSQSPVTSCAPGVDTFDKSLCGKYVTRKTVVTRQVTHTVKEVTTECIKDGVVLSKTVLEVRDEPPRVSTHSTFGLFVDDTQFLTDVSLVGTPPPAADDSAPGGVSTPTAGTPTGDQPHLHSTPKASPAVSEESAETTASGRSVSLRRTRRAPKGKGRKKKCAQMLDENPLGNTSCASTSSALSDSGRSCDIVEGARVLTKWEDGLWFPGHVTRVDDDNKSVDVEFDDGESGSALFKDVTLMNCPLPNGLEVLVKPSRSQRHIKGVVKGCPGNCPDGPYIVSYLKASGKFCLSEIVLVNKQALRFASHSKGSQGAGPTSSRRGTASLTTRQKVATSSEFFTGKFFVLTTSKEQEGEKSYDRDTLTSDIVCHGGMVVGSPLEVGGDMEGVFCVSDGPCRKRKFLLALAVGVPCVSFHFVLECVQKKRMVSYEGFLLPVGVSSTTGERVAWTPVCAGTIFDGVDVLVAGDESFKNQWEEILCAAGAHILGRLSLTSGGSISGDNSSAARTTVVVHQPSTHRQQSKDVSAILRRAEGLGVPVVQVDWAVESLMHRRRMSLDHR